MSNLLCVMTFEPPVEESLGTGLTYGYTGQVHAFVCTCMTVVSGVWSATSV